MESPSTEIASANSQDELVTIAGGVELEVTHLDGTKETVKVRQLPVSKIQQCVFAISFGNEAEAIALYCDKPKEWADTLTLQSVNAVADKGQELNLPFFEAWSRRQAKWRKTFGDATDGAETKQAEKVLPSDRLQPQSPITTS